MADFRNHPEAVRSGEELDLAELEPFCEAPFLLNRALWPSSNFPAAIPI